MVSIVIPDDLATFALAHPSHALVQSFIAEMQPHTLHVVGVRGENVDDLRTALHVPIAGEAGARLAAQVVRPVSCNVARTDANPWDPLESTCRHASLSIL